MEKDRQIRRFLETDHSRHGSGHDFREQVLGYFGTYGRRFPWRETRDPYAITVSEFMLQQTQTERVVPKYEAFLTALPTWESLAAASGAEVLILWEGLGYYRRAKNLHRAAISIVQDHGGCTPKSHDELQTLPGVGPYTAGAISTFSFGNPEVFIETNIRTLFLVSFFKGRQGVNDREVLQHVERTLDREDPRTWYYALMDLGAAIKRLVPRTNEQSAHHAKQSRFEGSSRQLRAAVLKYVVKNNSVSTAKIKSDVSDESERVERVLEQLVGEGFLLRERGKYRPA